MKRKIRLHILPLLLLLSFITSEKILAENKVVRFTENKGQWHKNVLYRLKINNGSMFLEKNRIAYHFASDEDLEHFNQQHTHATKNTKNNASQNTPSENFTINHHAFYVNFKNSNANCKITSNSAFQDYANYFIGNDAMQWASQVKSYNEIHYQNLYDNIDLKFSEVEKRLKYEFEVKAHAQPQDIALSFEGITNIYLKNGSLFYETSVNKIEEFQPYSYQIINGKKKEVASQFKLVGNTVSFEFPNGYNSNYNLIIDPVLIFSSYTGSLADNFGFTATYDDAGNLYAGGIARAAGYPTTPGAFQSTYAGGVIQGQFLLGFDCDMAISKFTSDGTTLLYSTYIGGSINDQPHSLVVDKDTNLIVLGRTNSNNYPTTRNAFDNSFNGQFDIVVTKLNKNGTALIGSTFIGGSGSDGVNISQVPIAIGSLKYNYADDSRSEVIIDSNNNIYVAACTRSSDFPVSFNALQQTISGNQDACVFELSANLDTLRWSTYLGGNGDDAAYSLVLDVNENIIICGGTNSTNFPFALNTYQGGLADGFIVRLNATGSSIISARYIGTPAYDQCHFVQLDGDDNAYLFGQTEGNIPSSPNTYNNPNSGQYILSLDPLLVSVRFSTTIGTGDGFPDISPTAFLIDNCRNIYLSGWGSPILQNATIGTAGLPITNDAFQPTTDGADFYFMVLSENAQQLLYASFFGGTASEEHVDGGTSRFDKNGIIYQAVCAGCGGNDDFPTTPGVVSNTNNSQAPQRNCNVGVIKFQIAFNTVDVNITTDNIKGCVPLTINFNSNGFQTDSYLWNFGNGQTTDDPNPTFTYTQPGSYIVTLFGRDTSCVDLNLIDSSLINIFVKFDSVIANFNYNLIANCDTNTLITDNVSINANQYLWDFGDSTFSSLFEPLHSYDSSGTFNITLIATNDTACISSDTVFKTVEIVVKFDNEINLAIDTACTFLTTQFETTNNSLNNETYLWDFGDGTITTTENPFHIYNTPGTYTITLITTDSSYCNITDTAIASAVIIPNDVIANFEIDSSYQLFEEIQFNNTSSNATQYLWNFGDGENSIEENPRKKYREDGLFTPCLTASNRFGCVDTICKPVNIIFVSIVDIANAFSPNGDGQNDIIYVKGYGIKELEFRIYNRWGQLIFESNDVNIGWDGTFKNIKQEAEVYVYTLKATFENGETSDLKKGNITLLR